jgi:hypothetical protein
MEFCDFCGVKDATWAYPGPSTTWTVCNPCHVLVEATDRDSLAGRGVAFFMPLSAVTGMQLLGYVQELQARFWDELAVNIGNDRGPYRL